IVRRSSFFFFQAEDGIRDLTVTGVQTCALPIYLWGRPTEAVIAAIARLDVTQGAPSVRLIDLGQIAGPTLTLPAFVLRSSGLLRSEERRVGKECRSRWSPYH